MEKIIIEADRRARIGKKVKALRRDGKLPAVIYGYGLETTAITMDAREASRILAGVGPSTLVYIELEGKSHAALVRERQFEVLTRQLLHVDFQALSLLVKVKAMVNVIMADEEAPVVADQGALLIQSLETVEIEALPQALPDRIIVDISVLKEIGDSILVKDLVAPAGVEILDDPEATVIVATYPEAAPSDEDKELDEELEEGMQPEVIERGKAGEDDFED
ncbi:MAG: 50S ribosomal protein L25 [Anaerolineales bacterium]|nr:50S ribosomal protein L25 [Anaerolineales bacterium]